MTDDLTRSFVRLCFCVRAARAEERKLVMTGERPFEMALDTDPLLSAALFPVAPLFPSVGSAGHVTPLKRRALADVERELEAVAPFAEIHTL